MKKTRTLKMQYGYVYYRGIRLGMMSSSIGDHFGIFNKEKLKITVEEKGPYKFRPSHGCRYYRILKNSKSVGLVCRDHFERLFFKPDGRKRYGIQIKVL